jgi:dienelactone hydrolase
MLRKSFTLINNDGEYVRGDLRYREDARDAPAIIICHGFKGFKDWGFFPVLGETLANAGYATIVFNFSRNGIGADPHNFTELEKFALNTYSHELSDLQVLVNAIQEKKLGNGIVNIDNIGMMGHSRGGGIALLYCQKNNDISALVTWSAISTVNRYSKEEVSLWKKQGYIEIENKRTRQIMRLQRDLLDDIEKNSQHLDILNAAGSLELPTLIIHGESDEAVSSKEGKEIFEALAAPEKQLMLIEQGTHTFNVTHPMTSRTIQFETALDLTESWFDKYLNY